ncbi:MAG: hypothetical protein ACE145_04060 [Terriglobia bacterium]
MSEVAAAVFAGTADRKKAGLGILAIALTLGAAGWNIQSWPGKLRYPGEHTDIEGMRLVEMVHLRQGIPIYAGPAAKRFDASIYGPLYYLFGSRIVDPAQPAFFPLRLVSVLATLGCAAGCGLLTYRLGRSWLAVVLAPLLFLSYGFVVRLGASARADSLAVLMALGGFLVAYKFRHSRAIFLSVPLMLAAFFYKQQYVAGPVAVALWLLLQRRVRDAAQFIALMSATVVALVGVFQFVVFRGQDFLLHFFLYNVVPLSWLHFTHAGLLFFGLVLLIPTLMGLEFLRVHRNSLLGCYLGCSGVLGLLGTAKAGSDAHYWFEFVLVLCVVVAALVGERIEAGNRPAEVIVLLVISSLVAHFFVPPGPRQKDLARDQRIQEFLRRRFRPGTPVLTRYAGDVVRAGLDLPISDLDQYLYLVQIRKFALSEEEARLQAQRYPAVVLNFDITVSNNPKISVSGFPESWASVILQKYEEVGSLDMPEVEKVFDDDRFHVWVPRSH